MAKANPSVLLVDTRHLGSCHHPTRHPQWMWLQVITGQADEAKETQCDSPKVDLWLSLKCELTSQLLFKGCLFTFYCCYCCHSGTKLWLTLCDPMDYSTPGLPVFHYLLEFAQTDVHWVGDAIHKSHPLFPPSPPALDLSQHQGFFFYNESAPHIRWPKYWSFSFSISPSNEYLGLI